MDIKERAKVIVERVKRIILTPRAEWAAIEAEPLTVREIYLDYVVYLAAIPAVSNFFGNWVFGHSRGAEAAVRASFGGALWRALLQYGLGLPLIYLVALGVSRLAPTFDGKADDLRALKLVAFSYTPIWIAEIFGLVPGLRWLDVLGLYSVFLFYIGVPVLTRCKEEHSDVFTAAAAGLGMAAAFFHGAIVHVLTSSS